MGAQFMHFWNDRDREITEQRSVQYRTLDELRASNPVIAVTHYEFEGWDGFGGFLLESNTKLRFLECTMEAVAAFEDEALLKAAVCKLDCWTIRYARLRKKEVESLCAAYLATSNSPAALSLDSCDCAPELIPQLVSHIERLAIADGDCSQLGEALKQPSSTLCDLSLAYHSRNLDWLADALRSPHCKLRRLALTGIERIPEQLLQALQSPSCRLEGFEISTLSEDMPDEESLVKALIASPSLWFFQTACSRLLLHEGILKARNISHFVLSALPDLHEAVCLIPEFLSRPDCSLQSFIILLSHGFRDDWQLFELQEAVLDALESNYHSQLQELQLGPWLSTSLDVRCSNLLYRNRLSKDSLGKYVHKFSQPPHVLKLFMCGHPGVGKTTITTNILRPDGIPVPAYLQRHSSTQGISLSNLEFGGKNLVIFDLAGQEVYHAFHHYFTRRSEHDLFLIVCKLDREISEDPQQNLACLKRLLTYWLRFIVSHQSPNAQTKPKVFVVLNYFCKPDKLQYSAPKAVNEVLERFRTEVNLKDVLEVVALKASKLSKLRESLEHAAEDTVRHLPPVPKICNDFIAKKHARKWQRQSMIHEEKTAFRLDRVWHLQPVPKICNDSIAEKHARKWYQRQSMTHEEKTVFRLDELKGWLPDIEDEVARSKALKFTLMCLHNMGEAIYFGSTEDASELHDHAILDVPWFVQDVIRKFIPKLPRNDGRCTEKAIVGINPLHEKLRKLLRPDQEDPENTVIIIVKHLEAMGLIIPHWEDNDKVIIPTLLNNKFPGWQEEGTRYRYWGRRIGEAERILSSMRYCTLDLQQACPVLRIEEHVLNPADIKALLLHQEPNSRRTPVLLDDLKHIDGLEFSWDPNNRSSIGELLMLSELKQLLESRQSVVEDFNSIAPVYELERSIPAMPEFENPDMRKLAEYLTGILQGHLQQLEVSMQTMIDTLCRVERGLKVNQEQMLNSLSKILQHIQVPKLPYFTDEKNLFFKYSNLAGTRVWIHYMCESGQLKHRVDHNIYKGVPITIAHDWIKKYTSVLVPAITVSFLIAKVGTTAAGIPVTDVLDFAEERLKTTINACFGQSINVTQPAEHEVAEVLEHVKKAAGETNLTVLMRNYFGLSFHKGAWVCEKHKL